MQVEQKREKHWTEKGWTMAACRYCVFPDGRPGRHGVPTYEPSPWKEWRRAANRHCSTCCEQGLAPDPTRKFGNVAKTPDGTFLFPCRCTQPGYEFPMCVINEEAYRRVTGEDLSRVTVETVPADPEDAPF